MNSLSDSGTSSDANGRLASVPHFEVNAALAAAIIAKRTEALEKQERSHARSADAFAACIFALGEERFALPVAAVEAVIKARAFGAIPVADQRILGSLFERGELWIVFSLRALLGGAREPKTVAGHLLLLHSDGRRAAILVDRVEEIASIKRGVFTSSAAADGAAGAPLVVATAPDGLMLLDGALLWSLVSGTQRIGK